MIPGCVTLKPTRSSLGVWIKCAVYTEKVEKKERGHKMSPVQVNLNCLDNNTWDTLLLSGQGESLCHAFSYRQTLNCCRQNRKACHTCFLIISWFKSSRDEGDLPFCPVSREFTVTGVLSSLLASNLDSQQIWVILYKLLNL